MTKLKEVWKDVKGFEGKYKVSNLGRVVSISGKWNGVREMSGSIDSFGYKVFAFRKDRTKKDWRLHRLLAEHFIPNPSGFNTVDHIDGNKLNNDLSNLRWCSRGENMSAAFRSGLIDKKGEKHHQNKLTESEVRKIRKWAKDGMTHMDISNMLGGKVKRRHVGDIVNGKSWGWL